MSKPVEVGDEFPNLNYFICTLGQAAQINAREPHDFSTVNDFLDRQAQLIPNRPAVGFPKPSLNSDGPWGHDIVTFGDLLRGSKYVAKRLADSVLPRPGDLNGASRTVATLYPSSAEFLFLWLGLTRLGYSSLHIAPQCQPAAIAHLCKASDISKLFYQDSYKDLAGAASAAATGGLQIESFNLQALPLSFFPSPESVSEILRAAATESVNLEPYWVLKQTDELYVHHSSGTSSGVPKPIPQSHRGAVGGLPCLSNGWESATLTTTPLYHAGISDLFRAWTSGGMVWLFPGSGAPITAKNIIKCGEVASLAAQDHGKIASPPVKYFSSVPFVLQMMAEDQQGLNFLQEMEIVGVGGAALPSTAGDELVKKGVKLVSRFGNVECGFLLSSHRVYSKDWDWQYLRSSHGAEQLSFEAQDDETFELVVLPGWPQMNKRNRSDGSFATADLFSAHPHIPNAWKYHSRADSQITLVTGKKFDPAPLEDAIRSSPFVEDVLVVGNGRQSAGALIFRAKVMSEKSDNEFICSIWPEIERLNKSGPAHTIISEDLLFAVDKDELPLEKSSKGTIMRKRADDRFGNVIAKLYGRSDGEQHKPPDSSSVPQITQDEDVLEKISEIVMTVLSLTEAIRRDADLFAYGVDSVAAMEIRASVQRLLLPPSPESLPLNIVYDCGTIEKLTEFVLQRRHGNIIHFEDEIQKMLALAEKYGNLITEPILTRPKHNDPLNGTKSPAEDHVILTGATGALGAHLLDIYRERDSVSRIVCLVRAKDAASARERVNKSLLVRGKRTLDTSNDKVICFTSKLGDENLGLPIEIYNDLASRATIILHAAWAVNFSMRLRSFEKDHIAGVLNLINFALSSDREIPPAFLFCSSTASVMGARGRSPIPEKISTDPHSSSPLGYSRSKWVAESICRQAHQRSLLRGHIGVLRIGQLCGDTEGGVWNVTEAWPLMLSSVRVTNSLPDLDEPLSWLPVDIAACAVAQVASHLSSPASETAETPVYHVVNSDKTSTWRDLLLWMKNLESPFAVVSPKDWVSDLENLQGQAAKHPARKLLGLWKNAYASEDKSSREPTVDISMAKTMEDAPIMRHVQPINEEHFRLIYQWMEENMLGSEAGE
ncbi:MAG: putative NRPS-like protein biosynthetic cluster [Sclerophora amabilis]|nr:MAG: putative NRPS-like protein biosynthetic cluster [Sclerophora amabilis]